MTAPLTAFSCHKFGQGEIGQFPDWSRNVQVVQSTALRVGLGSRKHGVKRQERDGSSHGEFPRLCPPHVISA